MRKINILFAFVLNVESLQINDLGLALAYETLEKKFNDEFYCNVCTCLAIESNEIFLNFGGNLFYNNVLKINFNFIELNGFSYPKLNLYMDVFLVDFVKIGDVMFNLGVKINYTKSYFSIIFQYQPKDIKISVYTIIKYPLIINEAPNVWPINSANNFFHHCDSYNLIKNFLEKKQKNFVCNMIKNQSNIMHNIPKIDENYKNIMQETLKYEKNFNDIKEKLKTKCNELCLHNEVILNIFYEIYIRHGINMPIDDEIKKKLIDDKIISVQETTQSNEKIEDEKIKLFCNSILEIFENTNSNSNQSLSKEKLKLKFEIAQKSTGYAECPMSVISNLYLNDTIDFDAILLSIQIVNLKYKRNVMSNVCIQNPQHIYPVLINTSKTKSDQYKSLLNCPNIGIDNYPFKEYFITKKYDSLGCSINKKNIIIQKDGWACGYYTIMANLFVLKLDIALEHAYLLLFLFGIYYNDLKEYVQDIIYYPDNGDYEGFFNLNILCSDNFKNQNTEWSSRKELKLIKKLKNLLIKKNDIEKQLQNTENNDTQKSALQTELELEINNINKDLKDDLFKKKFYSSKAILLKLLYLVNQYTNENSDTDKIYEHELKDYITDKYLLDQIKKIGNIDVDDLKRIKEQVDWELISQTQINAEDNFGGKIRLMLAPIARELLIEKN